MQRTVKAEKYFNELVRIYTDHLGAERLVWGSDWTFTQFESNVIYAEMAARRSNFLRKNPHTELHTEQSS